MKKVVITQARMSSTRLPGKILLPLCGKPVLQNIAERIQQANNIDAFIVATSTDPSDDVVEQFCKSNDIAVFRGSLNHVLERYYQCALQASADIIVRCTADNALITGEIVQDAINIFLNHTIDYLSYKDGLPLGMHVEVFSFHALQKAYQEADNPECIEHVTPYIIKNPQMFNTLFYKDESDENHSSLRFTMDTPEDYEFVKQVYNAFGTNNFSYSDILSLLQTHPELEEINKDIRQVTYRYNGEK